MHDRPIARHVDDSVAWIVRDTPRLLRRARGFAPLPILLKEEVPTILAVGAHLKNTVALSVGRQVFISQHVGDLETPEAMAAFERVIADFLRLYEATPVAIAHDLHPDYLSTKWAEERGTEQRRSREREQRSGSTHLSTSAPLHLCISSVFSTITPTWRPVSRRTRWMGRRWASPGTGRATAPTARSGAGSFCWAMRPGSRGSRTCGRSGCPAATQPSTSRGAWRLRCCGSCMAKPRWRWTISRLSEPLRLRSGASWGRCLSRGVHAPVTTSAGRLFDGVAALIGLHQRVSFEGQAAMALEFVTDERERGTYPLALVEGSEAGPGNADRRPLTTEREGVSMGRDAARGMRNCSDPLSTVIDWQPLVEAVLADVRRGVAAGIIAGRFHNALVDVMIDVAQRVGQPRVALSGGCFQNRLLIERVAERLERAGFQVLLHRQVPPNDGGISLGQVAVAAARLR